MKMNKFFALLLLSAVFVACKKEPDSPPVNTLNQAKVVTIDSLRAMQMAVAPGGVSIDDSLTTFAIVTMDESSGNIYKNLYIQDHTGGIQVRLTASSDFAVGDSLRINLLGAYLSEYNGTIQLDSIDPDNDIVRQSQGHPISPAVMTVEDIIAVANDPDPTKFSDLEGTLVKVTDIQFTTGNLTTTYADAINQSSENRILESCAGGANILVRTSGFADFAGDTVAQGQGDMTVIIGRFGSDIQLLIRNPNEINLNGARCAGQILIKDFDDNDVTSGGWSDVVVVGTTIWETSTAGGAPSPYGVISNYNGSNTAAENWLISPSVDLSGSSTPNLSFRNAYNFNGPTLQLLVSTDYTGVGNPNSATWTDLSSQVNWSSGSFTFVESGSIDLSAYAGGSLRIAFKYTGSNSDGSTWEIDDIIING